MISAADIDALLPGVLPPRYLACLALYLHDPYIVELGTGDGASASWIMNALEKGKLITINWPNPPSGDDPLRYLAPWVGDRRLKMLTGDTCDAKVAAQVPGGINLLYIDSTHTRECAKREWALYRPKLADGALVVIDDLDHNDMKEFWDELDYDKTEIWNGRGGLLRYEKRE